MTADYWPADHATPVPDSRFDRSRCRLMVPLQLALRSQDTTLDLRHLATDLERDRAAVDAALTLFCHNGRAEGANNKIGLLKRQTYGRADHTLLRQRVLLG
ncbi:transposase [Streptomyces melanogenes]|uniref:transposase n=1 Tax=Streptomyces melanogenes TaxID=67326 RepID=UPI003796D9F6